MDVSLSPELFRRSEERQKNGTGAAQSPHPLRVVSPCNPLVPPNIEPGPVNKAVLENASVTLECLASGVPPPGKTPPFGQKSALDSPNSLWKGLQVPRALYEGQEQTCMSALQRV